MNFVSLYPIECEQTELKNMENPFEEQQNKLQRPTFLLVLCILTFIGSGWGTLSNLFSVFTAGLTDSSMQMEHYSSMLNSMDQGAGSAVLSDILGDEDHLGDMDFKVTGTRDGITATQMDIKVDGLSYEVLEKALNQAKEGRMYILDKILDTIPEPRADFKPHVPRIEVLEIPKDMIGAVIGPGGKIIQGIQEETGAIVTIDEIDGVGRVEVAAPGRDAINAALARIKGIVAIPEVGEVYTGKVKSILPFGAFVEFMPGKDGLLHISEICWKRLETMEESGLKEGDEVTVKLVEIDPKTGKFRLSMKELQPRPEGMPERREGNGGGNGGNHNHRPRREKRD